MSSGGDCGGGGGGHSGSSRREKEVWSGQKYQEETRVCLVPWAHVEVYGGIRTACVWASNGMERTLEGEVKVLQGFCFEVVCVCCWCCVRLLCPCR